MKGEPTVKHMNPRSVYIVDGARTPFLKARGKPGPFTAGDLAVYAGRDLLLRLPILPTQLDEVIMGCVIPREYEANIGRITALRLGCGPRTPGWTVQRNCASGMQALDGAFKDIALGRAELVLAGGTEAMSHSPLVYHPKMVHWFADWQQAKNIKQKCAVLRRLNIPALFSPIVALLGGLSDPLSGLSMGDTAEILAQRFNITRSEMDHFSLRSHQRAAALLQSGFGAELIDIFDTAAQVYAVDDGVRSDTTFEKLSNLKPFFDRKFGVVTAGNSSQISDGAAVLLLASEAAIERYHLPVLARLIDIEWAGLDPDVMGLGPVMAATPLLQRHHLSLSDIDYWEINEAFAAQVIACIRAWQDDEFCQQALKLNQAFGVIDETRLNIDGGAIALGHPVGASGARIVLHLAHILKRHQARRGVAAICIGGGQGGALLLEGVK